MLIQSDQLSSECITADIKRFMTRMAGKQMFMYCHSL